MKNRILVIITIGYVLGILWELYTKKLALFFCYLLFILLLEYQLIWRKRNKREKKKYLLYLNSRITSYMLVLLAISFLLGFTYTNCLEKKYREKYNGLEGRMKVEGIISCNKEEGEYQEKYRFTY